MITASDLSVFSLRIFFYFNLVIGIAESADFDREVMIMTKTFITTWVMLNIYTFCNEL